MDKNTIFLILAILPLAIICYLAVSGATECKDSILEEVPNAMVGENEKMQSNVETYCSSDSNKFKVIPYLTDLVVNYYILYLVILAIIWAITEAIGI